jgi:hypothetical protein
MLRQAQIFYFSQPWEISVVCFLNPTCQQIIVIRFAMPIANHVNKI